MEKIQKLQFKWLGAQGSKLGYAVLLLIYVLIPVFVHSPYLLHLVIMVGIFSVMAMSFSLQFRTGLINLAIAGFWGVGAYTSAVLTMRLSLPVWWALPVSTIITALVAWLFGLFLISKGGMSFVMLSLAFAFIVTQVFGSFNVFGGRMGLYNIPPPETIHLPFNVAIVFNSKIPYYYLSVVLVVFIILVLLAFNASWAGRAWKAIGLGPRLAESLGVNVFRYRLMGFIIGAAIVGLMGSFYAHYYLALTPDTFGPFQAIYAQVYAILGGINFVIMGPIVGSLILTIVPEVLRISREMEPIYAGIIVILLVMFLPDGVLGLFSAWRHGFKPGENLSRFYRWVRALLSIST